MPFDCSSSCSLLFYYFYHYNNCVYLFYPWRVGTLHHIARNTQVLREAITKHDNDDELTKVRVDPKEVRVD